MTAVALPDGRRLAYQQYGPADGTPVLFVPGAGCGRLMTFGDDDVLHRHHVRMICVDRPGLGDSTHHTTKTFTSVADDVGHLVRTVVGEPVPVIANSQGAPFGLAMAAGHWTRALVLASPIDDIAFPAITDQLPDPLRDLVAAVAADPRAVGSHLLTFTAQTVFDMVMADYPASDAAVYDRPEFRAQFRAALDDGFRSGPAGYAGDTVLAMSAWPSAVFEPRVPVHILFGAEDGVHSPDLGLTLSRRISRARRDVVAGTGGALLWSHAGLVLQAAADLVR
ncbi:MAG: hypothetical protein K0R68_906 [Mycobacterium sp.]|nr:hypothetical protein [Mycobacterium sp.]